MAFPPLLLVVLSVRLVPIPVAPVASTIIYNRFISFSVKGKRNLLLHTERLYHGLTDHLAVPLLLSTFHACGSMKLLA